MLNSIGKIDQVGINTYGCNIIQRNMENEYQVGVTKFKIIDSFRGDFLCNCLSATTVPIFATKRSFKYVSKTNLSIFFRRFECHSF